MAVKVKMSQVWKARNLILHGYSVKEVAVLTKMSENSVRNYTKAERAKKRSKQLV